jgi:hemin uptake protein HemP
VSALLQGEREVILEHDGLDYRLRITANGKLILTK